MRTERSPSQNSSRRRDILLCALLLFLVALSWFPRWIGPIDLRWDGAVYYLLGTSLNAGMGYRLLNEPGEIRETQYPPLLPTIISVHQFALKTVEPSIVGHAMKVTWIFFFAVYTLTVYFLARSFLPSLPALLVAVMSVFSYHSIYISDACYPEIFFLAFSALFFIALRVPGKIYSGSSFVLAAVCFLLRSSGIALLATWVLQSVFRLSWKEGAARLVVAAIPILVWFGYVGWVESNRDYKHPAYKYQRADYLFWNVSYAKNLQYKDPFQPELGKASVGDLVRRFSDNLIQTPVVFSELLTINQSGWYNSWKALERKLPLSLPWTATFAFLLIPGLFLVLGLVYLFVRREWAICSYILISIALLCLAPWRNQLARYAVPLTPFLVVGAISFLWRIKQTARKSFSIALFLFLAGILILEFFPLKQLYGKEFASGSFTSSGGKAVPFRWFHYDASYQALDRGFDWLSARIDSKSALVTSMPAYAYLRTGRKSVMPPLVSDPAEAQHLLELIPARFVIVDAIDFNTPSKYLMLPISQFPDRWRKIYSDQPGGVVIYEYARR